MNKQDAIEILSEVKELDDSMYQYNPAYMEALDMGIAALAAADSVEKKVEDSFKPKTIMLELQENSYVLEPQENSYYDPVDRPKHYAHGKIECIDAMLDVYGKEAVEHFCLLNAFKYLWRSEYKNGLEDIEKAIWYLDHLVKLEKDNEN